MFSIEFQSVVNSSVSAGWAQVNGYRGETKELKDMEGRVKYDIYYVENWSYILDMKIIWRTVFNMFRGEEKAY